MQENVRVRISRVGSDNHDLHLPHYATEGSAGMDLCAAVEGDVQLMPSETKLIPTGFTIELPQGYEAQIRPRSGMALKFQVGIMNAPGTVDSDYRGEIKVLLTNFGKEPYSVKRGDRIAQMVIHRFTRVEWEEVEKTNDTARGAGGFGHTGTTTLKR